MGKSSTSAFAHILQCFGVVEPADLSGRLRPGQPSCCTLTVELVVNSGYIKAQDLVGADLWKACVGMRRAGVAWHETLWRAIQLEQHLQHAIAFNAPALILKATNRARADRVDVIALAGTIDLARHACPIHGSLNAPCIKCRVQSDDVEVRIWNFQLGPHDFQIVLHTRNVAGHSDSA